MKQKRTLIAFAAAALLLVMPSCEKKTYYYNEGLVFGTYYNIRYEATRDMEPEIKAELARMDESLSIYNKKSIISRVNRNDDVPADRWLTSGDLVPKKKDIPQRNIKLIVSSSSSDSNMSISMKKIIA